MALVVALVFALLWLRDHEDLEVTNPRHPREFSVGGSIEVPALVRFRHRNEQNIEATCWGLVQRVDEERPAEVVDLCRAIPGLEGTFDDLLARDVLSEAERLWMLGSERIDPAWLVRLDRTELAERLLPPLDTTLEQLEQEERFIVGVGLNYDEHAEDVDAEADEDAFLFAKIVAPTGAYAPLRLGPAAIEGATFAPLVDYEVELGFVLLEEIRLDAIPSPDELAEKIAWVHANDVSDRAPILLEGDAGFTRAKSRPTFLPLGPWLVHGRHVDPLTARGGRDEVELSLRVVEETPHERGSHRQHARSRELVRGPREILELAGRIQERSVRGDTAGNPRGIVRTDDGRPVLPRGTLILTGTPGGTAIDAPGMMDRARLFLLGNLSVEGARPAFLRHCVRHRYEMGFLSPGDVVDATIDHLGRQTWIVEP